MATYRRRRSRKPVRPGVQKTRRSHSTDVVRQRRSKQSSFAAFLRRNYKIVAAVGFVLVVGVIVLFLFVIGKDNMPASDTADAAQTEAQDAAAQQTPTDTGGEIGDFDEESEYDADKLSAEEMEGITGSGDDMFGDLDEDMADALFAEEGIRIGVTIGNLNSDIDEMQLGKLEAASTIAEFGKVVYDVYFYDAHGDYNQQIQDVRSMIKNEVDVIIVGATDQQGLDTVTGMAKEEGIPVIAYDAAGDADYAVNVVADQKDWGRVYGEFMAQNLPEGDVLCILGSDESDIDAQRETGIRDALAANENIEIADTIYAKWDDETAAEAFRTYLEHNRMPKGIIIEEGMAQAVLEVCIEEEELPDVMCGDATAGFIRMWRALKTDGIDITPPPEKGQDEDPDAPRIMFKAEKKEFIVCIQPAPVSIGAFAFDIAVKLAEERELLSPGSTVTYTVETVLTEKDLVEVYVTVKDQPDDYVVRDIASEEAIEALLKPAEQEA